MLCKYRPSHGEKRKVPALMNDIEGILTVWSSVSVCCSALHLVLVVLPGSCGQSALADASWRHLDEHIPFPVAAISIPILEAVNGRRLVGWVFSLIFSFYFPLFLPIQPPQETIPQSDCCSCGEEHSFLGSSVALTCQLMELVSLLGLSLGLNRSGNSIHFYFG